jgi:hypothetical protein
MDYVSAAWPLEYDLDYQDRYRLPKILQGRAASVTMLSIYHKSSVALVHLNLCLSRVETSTNKLTLTLHTFFLCEINNNLTPIPIDKTHLPNKREEEANQSSHSGTSKEW